MATSIDSLFPFVAPEVKDCPTPLVRQAVLRAAIKFCKDSLAWTATEDMVPVTNSEHTFEIDRPMSQSHLVVVKNVWAAKAELTPLNMTEIARIIPDWQTRVGTPQYYNQPSATEIRLFPIPAYMLPGTTVTIRAAFAPIPTAKLLDDDLVNLYFEAIAHGALSTLQAMAKQPWADPVAAAAHEARFLAEIDKAKIEMLTDRTVSSMRVMPRNFQKY